jgi:hypothetical protein
MKRTMPRAIGLAAIALSLGVVGCARESGESRGKAATPTNRSEPHGHEPGAHGGIIVEIGSDNYHAEAVFQKGGVLRLYMLGRDERKVQEVEAQPLTAYAKTEGDSESQSMELRPDPQPGDKSGMTSAFVGQLPADLVGKNLEVVIPSIRIEGERFRLSFKSAPEPSHSAAGMPTKVADEAERKLYLTPGGAYTEADIAANGNVTASTKFKGIRAEHDMKPKPGDKICPITMTKANPKFTWIVGGKPYEFCCPPCVDEFVAQAKEKPTEIQDPESYRKK